MRQWILGTVLPFVFCAHCYAGELVGNEAERELLYPNIVPPKVVIGGYGSALSQFLDITDVVFRDNNSFYVSECTNNRVQEFLVDGHRAGAIVVPCPANVTYDAGVLAVLSEKTNRIYLIASDSRAPIVDWDAGDGNVTAISIYASHVFALPRHGGEIRVFDLKGALLKTIKAPWLERASDMTVVNGDFFIVDKLRSQIIRLSGAGEELSRFGSYGTFRGELANPHGIGASKDTVVVADTVNHRLQEFDSHGNFVLQWGRHPITPQETSRGRMHYPHNVSISPDKQHIVVCEPYESKCDIFETGDIKKTYTQSDDSAYWNKFFWFHYRGPSRIVKAAFFNTPTDAPLLFMGEEDIHRIVIAKLKDGVPETFTYFGGWGSGEGQFKGPEGVFPAPNGNVYVVDTGNNRVQAFDLSGKFKFAFGHFGAGPGEFNEPGQGSADEQGNLYISDSGNKRIQVFDANGKFIRAFGTPGNGQGQLNRPIDAFVDLKNGRVLVDDLFNTKIAVYDLAGNFKFEFGQEGTDIGQFKAPHSVVFDETTDSIFVSDMVANSIQKFSSDGKFLGRFGRYGMALGEFKTPAGLGALEGKLYVMDHTNHRGQILSAATGTALVAFGESIIGVPNDVLVARAKMNELEQAVKALAAKAAPASALELNNLATQVQSIKKEMSAPSILKSGHH